MFLRFLHSFRPSAIMQWCLWLLFIVSNPFVLCALKDQLSDTPDAAYVRRLFHSATIVDKFTLIIDGGELTQTVVADGNTFSLDVPMNYTIATDMSVSWDASNVSWTLIDRGNCSPMDNQVLWTDITGKTVYSFGGRTSASLLSAEWGTNDRPLPVDLYQFDPNAPLNGTWSTINAPSYQSGGKQQALNRPDQALGTTVGNTGFIVGGLENPWSQPGFSNLDNDVLIPGIASFNMTSNTWSNDTTPESAANIFLVGLQHYGPEGILISSGSSGIGTQSQSLNNITIYEPISKTWHVQNTTGNAPLVRDQPCAVSVLGDNGTYEIFLYGGVLTDIDTSALTSQQQADNNALDELWVLSIPAFVWFKANYTAQHSRYWHTCLKVGYRQFLSIGGVDPNEGPESADWTPDPARQGLLFFDMTNLVWDKGFNASTPTYTTAQVIKDWYANNDLPYFEDPALAALLNVTATASKTPPNSNPNPNRTPTPNPNPTPSPSHAGPIAGGVIGGIAALAICSAFCYFYLRRRNRRRTPELPGWNASPDRKSINYSDFYSELDSKQKPHEMNARGDEAELEDPLREPHELNGGMDEIVPEIGNSSRPSSPRLSELEER